MIGRVVEYATCDIDGGTCHYSFKLAKTPTITGIDSNTGFKAGDVVKVNGTYASAELKTVLAKLTGKIGG